MDSLVACGYVLQLLLQFVDGSFNRLGNAEILCVKAEAPLPCKCVMTFVAILSQIRRAVMSK